MTILLVRAQAENGREIDLVAVSPQGIGQNFLCAFTLDGTREHVDAERLQRLDAQEWVIRSSGMARVLQIVINHTQLPRGIRTWEQLADAVRAAYDTPRSL